MQFSVRCVECVLGRYTKLLLQQEQRDPKKALACMKEILVAASQAPDNVAAPYLVYLFDEVYARHFSGEDRYAAVKKASNQFVASRLPAMREVVEEDPEPLKAALRYARTCNYIDYGPLGDGVSEDFLDELLDKAKDEIIDETEYANFTRDLEKAKKLLYICDNAGEIVADRLVVEQLKKRYPKLEITVCVRGGAVINDATREDAEIAGLREYARIIDNGKAIGGTQIQYAGEELRRELEAADVILSKGQGNFETMHGCGLNVYFVFLCKCQWLVEMFGMPMFTGMFVNERRL